MCPQNVRRSIVVAVALMLGATHSAIAVELHAGIVSGCAVERAPTSGRLTPYLGATLGCGLPVAGGTVDLDAGLAAGALLGQVLSVTAGGSFRFGGLGAWQPRLGLEVECDFGDLVFASTGSLAVPPTPQLYAGLRLDPLRFAAGSWDLSWLEVSVSTGSHGWFSSIRLAVSLMSLAYRW